VDTPYGVAINLAGTIVVAGDVSTTSAFSWTVRAYSSNGTFLWSHTRDAESTAQGVVANDLGEFIVVGRITGSGWLISKYSAIGATLWNQTFLTASPNAMAHDVAVVPGCRDVVVIGHDAVTNSDWYVNRYDTNGAFVSSLRLTGAVSGPDEPLDVDVDPQGRIDVCGF